VGRLNTSALSYFINLRLHLHVKCNSSGQLIDRYQILPQPMFDSDHLLNAYDTHTPANAHKLACVYFVLAIGVMFDLNRQPCERPLPSFIPSPLASGRLGRRRPDRIPLTNS
jgi:hypothetical protein